MYIKGKNTASYAFLKRTLDPLSKKILKESLKKKLWDQKNCAICQSAPIIVDYKIILISDQNFVSENHQMLENDTQNEILNGIEPFDESEPLEENEFFDWKSLEKTIKKLTNFNKKTIEFTPKTIFFSKINGYTGNISYCRFVRAVRVLWLFA